MSEAVKSVNQILATPLASIVYLGDAEPVVLNLIAAVAVEVDEVVGYVARCCDPVLIDRLRSGGLPAPDTVPEFADLASLFLMVDDDRRSPEHEARIGRSEAWLAWAYNPNMKSCLERDRTAPDVARRLYGGRTAYALTVGSDGSYGFKLFDRDGDPRSEYTVENGTLDDVLSAVRNPK